MLVPHPNLPERVTKATLAETLLAAQRSEAHVGHKIDPGNFDPLDEATNVVTLISDGGHSTRSCRQQPIDGHAQSIGDVGDAEDSRLNDVSLLDLPQRLKSHASIGCQAFLSHAPLPTRVRDAGAEYLAAGHMRGRLGAHSGSKALRPYRIRTRSAEKEP
jgi:hypothetical protein